MFTRPAIVLRLEEASLLLASVLLYKTLHFSWLLFAVLFLVPDLSMLGYLRNPRLGSALYNLGHAIFLPVLFFLFAFATQRALGMAIGIIWFAHIVWDRMLGYGLKYQTHFKDTHLQHIP
jgi:hypothetical protein